jgi:hypothetical protein
VFLLTLFSSSFMLIGYLSILIKTFIYSYSRLTNFLFTFK